MNNRTIHNQPSLDPRLYLLEKDSPILHAYISMFPNIDEKEIAIRSLRSLIDENKKLRQILSSLQFSTFNQIILLSNSAMDKLSLVISKDNKPFGSPDCE